MSPTDRCCAIVIGGSAGALDVILQLIDVLPAGFEPPICVCLHVPPDHREQLAECLREHTVLPVFEAQDKQLLERGKIYVAPANYHLLIERDGTVALSTDAEVHFCRPSIDVMFESAARAWGKGLLAILLSGANDDGASGLGLVRARGGLTVAQDPAQSIIATMPHAGIEAGAARLVLSPRKLCDLVLQVHTDPSLERAAWSFRDARS